jgi:hypothetical protein
MFGGIGLIDLVVEQLICRINMFQQPYSAPTMLGHRLSVSLHWLQLQIGMNESPLCLSYSKYATLTPISWVKALWEQLDKYDIGLVVLYDTILMQRVDNETVMSFLEGSIALTADQAAIN